ncbi:hypothetical protein ACFL2H_09105 [Planctomycetota bacterium]
MSGKNVVSITNVASSSHWARHTQVTPIRKNDPTHRIHEKTAELAFVAITEADRYDTNAEVWYAVN